MCRLRCIVVLVALLLEMTTARAPTVSVGSFSAISPSSVGSTPGVTPQAATTSATSISPTVEAVEASPAQKDEMQVLAFLVFAHSLLDLACNVSMSPALETLHSSSNPRFRTRGLWLLPDLFSSHRCKRSARVCCFISIARSE
jgi:hypothetical protein